MLYFAYGSNTCMASMKARCPAAVPLRKMMLRDSALVFRHVADCIWEPGSKTPGGIWKITDACEEALDRYEGIHRGLYRKESVTLAEPFHGETEVMLYVMNSTGILPPSPGYLDIIKQGYRDFGLPLSALRAAVKRSIDDKHPSHIERARYRRKGRPPLVQSEKAV